MQSTPNNVYYRTHGEYDLIMSNKYQLHDSGIVDEGLSDETGSIGEDLNNQSNENDGPKKPSQSYLEIIAEAILKSPNRMMQLYEIYDYFQRKYRYFAEDVNKSWRNSVRHNLSLNECFVKAGRGNNGKGHFWRIHELAEVEFEQGRFRRRRYRQQIRQLHMQPPPVHQSSYTSHQPLPNYYQSPPHPYYMCSSSPPSSYHAMYSTPNTSIDSHSMSSSTPNSYALYDPYQTSYYPTAYHSMTSSYSSPNQSVSYETE
ncbi:unnamed protein product [Adineta ricciae]|uniref:Fork-head domain-containing protein n=1 Tax=Adineta ricciae TaxID=249248 RepID=A0A814MY24_ADIRI|nr:unnamed protein product [Adineta ricciae]